MIAGLEALIDVGKRYNLPTEHIVAERAKYGVIPDSAEELQATLSPKNQLDKHN